MADIFISHAVADQKLADKFVAFLKEAIGVPAKSIFCSSVAGQGIPLGHDFNDYMKNQIQKPKLVVLLMTPRYMESWFCLMELGATWAKSHVALPIVVPPIKFNAISSTLGLKQGWSIDDDSKLIDFRQMIQSLNLNLEHRTEHDWEKKRALWKIDLMKILKEIEPPTNVSASDHKVVQDDLKATKSELVVLQEAMSDALDTIEKLKVAKDATEVKSIISSKTGLDPEFRFHELLSEILSLRPKISMEFYRNIIMDLYGKSIRINWYDHDQKADAEAAIQYNLMEPEAPYSLYWNKSKLKKISAAVKALDSFLESEEAASFVKSCVRNGLPMETDDLAFWEEHLS